jgi:hypothetical protein
MQRCNRRYGGFQVRHCRPAESHEEWSAAIEQLRCIRSVSVSPSCSESYVKTVGAPSHAANPTRLAAVAARTWDRTSLSSAYCASG